MHGTMKLQHARRGVGLLDVIEILCAFALIAVPVLVLRDFVAPAQYGVPVLHLIQVMISVNSSPATTRRVWLAITAALGLGALVATIHSHFGGFSTEDRQEAITRDDNTNGLIEIVMLLVLVVPINLFRLSLIDDDADLERRQGERVDTDRPHTSSVVHNEPENHPPRSKRPYQG